mmetsp:Transcript_5993/g.13961  ORF Transcript_5993/g.13961 Transcript_5993/m.13961 type:complete len:408 (+) Transcript_5993:65-1288(+)
MDSQSPSSPSIASKTYSVGVQCFQLDHDQIDEYLKNGVLVVDNVLTECELQEAKNGLMQSLQRRGIQSFDVEDEESAIAFQKLSSTNGSGGVLDIFHDNWKLKLIATHPKLFSITQQLWKAGYNCGGNNKDSLPEDLRFQWHPYGGDVDFENKGFCYIDRVGYRLPTELAQEWGGLIHKCNTGVASTSKKKKKLRSVQRSLTPHLDCCPDTLYENTNKWRPIQCFVSLTDNLEANTGGFEAALGGFHHTFDQWAKSRNNEATTTDHSTTVKNKPAPCLGEYTHIRPKEDADVMKRVCHISVKAGSAVFWDNRIPHANAYRNDNKYFARAVVYSSFLPDIALNRRYVKNQLRAWKLRQPIRDQWNHIPGEEDKKGEENLCSDGDQPLSSVDEGIFTDLGKRLMGIEPW